MESFWFQMDSEIPWEIYCEETASYEVSWKGSYHRLEFLDAYKDHNI